MSEEYTEEELAWYVREVMPVVYAEDAPVTMGVE